MTKRLQKRTTLLSIILIIALLATGIVLAIVFSAPKRASAEVSVWSGELASAGWEDESTDVWGIVADAQTAGKTAAPAGYEIDVERKTIDLGSAAALAYFSHEIAIDVEHKLDEYTVTLTTDVDLDNKFWIPIGSFGNRAQNREDSVDNTARFSGTFKGEVRDGDSVRAAKITNFTYDVKEVFKDATIPQYADAGRNGFKDVTLEVGGSVIKLETGDEGMVEASSVYYSQVEPFMVKFETEDDIRAYNAANGTDIPEVNTVGGLIINDDIKAYYDEKRSEDPEHAAEYNMLQNRFYNRIGGECRIVYKEYNRTFAEYFRSNRTLNVYKLEYIDQIREGSATDRGVNFKDTDTGALDTSITIYEGLRTAADAGQVYSYGFFASTKNAVISGLRFELGNDWDFSNYGVTVLDSDGEDTGLKENLIADQAAVLIGFGYGNLTVIDCQVGTPEHGGLIYGTSYSNPAYGGLVGRMYGAHCGLPSSDPEDAAARPDEYYNKNLKAEFKNCKNYVSFDTFDTGTLRCGGIAGYLRYHANYLFENCENYGQMQGVTAGGIAGCLQNGLIKTEEDGAYVIIMKNCKNYGNVESVLQDELNGTNYDLIHPNLNVRSRNSGIAGGMIGNLIHIGFTEGSKLILEGCENRGTIISDAVAGGLIAQMSDPSNTSIAINYINEIAFDDCYNYGNVTADVAFTKIPVKSELLNPNYSFTRNNTYSGAFIGRIASGTLPTGLTLYTVTYGTDGNGKYLTYGVPASNNANAYAKDKNGNYITYEDGDNTVYQRYTRDFLNRTLLIRLTGANVGRIVSADPARDTGADCISGGGARIFLKGSYFVDASDAASAVSNINLPDGFILWVTDAAGNGSSTRNATSGAYTNNLLNYISSVTNFTNNKYHYISGREGAAENKDFNENDFPTFEWVDEMEWATSGSTANRAALNVSPLRAQARRTLSDAADEELSADYTITYVANNGANSTYVSKDGSESGTLATLANLRTQIKAWNDADKTVDIVIASTVTSIAANAFYDSANKLKIKSVTFAVDDVTQKSKCATVGSGAFRHTEIGEFITSEGVTSFANSSVFQDASIGSVVLNDGFKTIGQNAFNGATVTALTYYTSVTSVNANSFTNATIGTLTVKRSATAGTDDEYSVPANAVKAAKTITSVVIEEGVTAIGANAFNGANATTSYLSLGSVSLPSTLKKIGANAFLNAALPAITIPASVTEIGNDAFNNYYFWYNTGYSHVYTQNFAAGQRNENALTKITLEDNSRLETIGNNAFRDAHIVKMDLPNTLKSIGNNAFSRSPVSGSTRLANIFGDDEHSITFDADGCTTLTAIGDAAFQNAYLESFTIPACVETIGANAFNNNNLWNTLYTQDYAAGQRNEDILTKISLADNSRLQTIGNSAFRDAHIVKMDLPNTLTSIGDYAFARSAVNTSGKKLANIYGSDERRITFNAVDSSITKFNQYVFANAYLGDFTIPAQVTEIGAYAFDCNMPWYELYTVNFAAGQRNENVLNKISLADNSRLQTIGNYAFRDAHTVKMDLPNTLTSIGNNAFYRSPASGTVRLANIFGADEHSITLNVGCTELKAIGDNAFVNAYLTSITIPACVETIGAGAFNNNNLWNTVYTANYDSGEVNSAYLTTIALAEGSQLKTIKSSAFRDTLFERLVLPESVTYIGDYAFARSLANTGAKKLANQSKHEVVLHNDGANLENLGNYAFYGAYLKKFRAHGDLADCSTGNRYVDLTQETVEVRTEEGSNGEPITAVAAAIPHKLANYVFSYATIDDLILDEGLVWIGDYAFAYAKIGGGRILVPSTVKWLGASVFNNTKSTDDEKIVLEFADPASIERLGASAFNGVNIVKLVISENIKDCTYGSRSELNLSTNRNINVYKFTNHSSILINSVFNGATVYDLTLNNHVFGSGVFSGAHIKTLTVNSDITSTTANLCNTSTQIYELRIGDSVDALVDGLFKDAKIYTVSINNGDIQGAPFEGAQIKELHLTENALVVGGTLLNNLLVGSVILPDGIENISAGVFTYSNIGTLVIPASVKKIDDFAFRATKVSHFRVAEGSQLKEIGAFAFGGAAIDSYILPEGLETIGNGAFAQVSSSVTTLELPSTLKYVGVKAFGGNTRLNTVYIPAEISTDAVFDSPFDSGTSQNPLFIVAEDAQTYFRLKDGNEYFVSESNFTYVVTVEFQDEQGNNFEELDAQQVLFGVGYSTSLVYGQWVNNSRYTLPDEFYNYVWRCGDEVVTNISNLDAIIRNGNTDTVILIGLRRTGGKYAFVARSNIVYNGTEYTRDNINTLLDNRFSLIDDEMDVQVIKYNQQTAENIVIKNAGTYTVSVTYDQEEAPILFDININRIVTAWDKIPYIISWDYSAFDKDVNNINAVPNYIAADLADANVSYTVTAQDGSELVSAFTTDGNGAVVEDAAVQALSALPVLADNGNYTLNISIPETVNYTALNDSLVFRVGVLNNSWTTSLKVMSWVQGRFNKEIKDENGETVYPIRAEALRGDVYIEVLANYTDADGKEIVMLDRTLCGSDELTDYLSDMDVGTYIIRASVDGTTNYTGLAETFIFQVFEKPGMPWWGTLLIVVGALAVAAAIIFILWKKGVFQILTGKIVLAIRTRANVDATIASVRAAKKMEEGRQSVAAAKRKEAAQARKEKLAAERALPAEERAATLEAKAQAEEKRIERIRARAEAMRARAERMRETSAEEVAKDNDKAQAEAAATESKEPPTEE